MVATLSRIDDSRPPKFSLFTKPQYITESKRGTDRRTHYRIIAKLTNMDTISPWESSVGVAKRKAALFILETLFERYGAPDEEITRLRERAERFEEYRPSGPTPVNIQCPLCPDVGPNNRLIEHLEGHIQAEVDEALRSARSEIDELKAERDRAIERTRSLTDELNRAKRELEEAKRRIYPF